MKLFKTKKIPPAIKEFIKTFTLAIKRKDLSKLKQHFSSECEFIFDYSKFGEGIHKQSLHETLKAFKDENLKLSKINNKIISYKEEKDLYVVTLRCEDYLSSEELSYMNYDEELVIYQEDKHYNILRLTCKFRKLKKS